MLFRTVVLYWDSCTFKCSVICASIEKNPPWILLSGLTVAFPALLTWYWRKVGKDADIENKRIENTLIKERQIAERFGHATEQLGMNNLAAQLGGVYELEKIAEMSSMYKEVVTEVLCAYVREVSNKNKLQPDIQSILTVLGRLDRGQTSRPKYDLSGANLNDSVLVGNYNNTSFKNAKLQHAKLNATNLKNCDFRFAKLNYAKMIATILSGSEFAGSEMNNTNLGLANFQGVHMTYNYTRFSIDPRDNIGPEMNDANLSGAHINDVDLGSVIGLNEEMLINTHFNKETKFPPNIDRSKLNKR